MSDRPQWSRDKCTCGHSDIAHEDGTGRCKECDNVASYNQGNICTRYQWNGEPRTRTW